MNKELLEALEICLRRQERGESLDSLLASYPAFAAQLRPLLETAACARAPQHVSISPQVLARQRTRGLALAAELRPGKRHLPRLGRVWRTAITFLSVAAFLLMSSNGLLLASAHSIPGDTLYPLKRSVELTQLQLVSDLHKRQLLERSFSERRVEETRSLITDKRVENVEFNGQVSFQSAGQWLVSGIPVLITSQTIIDASIQLGDYVEVDGITNTSGDVQAVHLSHAGEFDLDDGDSGLTPTPTTSPVVTPTPGEEASASSFEPSSTPAQSAEENHLSEDNHNQSSSGSHDEHSDSKSGGGD